MGDKVTFRLYLSEQVGEPRKDLEIESSGHGESVNKRCRFTKCCLSGRQLRYASSETKQLMEKELRQCKGTNWFAESGPKVTPTSCGTPFLVSSSPVEETFHHVCFNQVIIMKKWPLLYEVRTQSWEERSSGLGLGKCSSTKTQSPSFSRGIQPIQPIQPGSATRNAIGVWESAISVYIRAQISPRVGCSRDHAEHPTDIECSVKTSLEWCRLHLNYLGFSAIALQRHYFHRLGDNNPSKRCSSVSPVQQVGKELAPISHQNCIDPVAFPDPQSTRAGGITDQLTPLCRHPVSGFSGIVQAPWPYLP